MMMLRYDDDGGGVSLFSLLSLCLPPLISRRRRKDGSDAIRSAFLLLSAFECMTFVRRRSVTQSRWEACMHDWGREYRWVVGR